MSRIAKDTHEMHLLRDRLDLDLIHNRRVTVDYTDYQKKRIQQAHIPDAYREGLLDRIGLLQMHPARRYS